MWLFFHVVSCQPNATRHPAPTAFLDIRSTGAAAAATAVATTAIAAGDAGKEVVLVRVYSRVCLAHSFRECCRSMGGL